MPKKHLGQNFLFDPSILQRIVEAARLQPDDLVVEIGPGPGTLTRLLARAVKKVIAIELDEGLYKKLRGELYDVPHLELVHGDALTFHYDELGPFKVVANIPYYITTPLIFRLIETGRKNLQSMTLTIQKEVAERIAAGPGTKDYGVLSLAVQYYGDPELEFIIPKGAFRPVPKVDSAVIHIEMRKGPKVKVQDEKLFFRIIRTAFSQRRKMLSNSLRTIVENTKERLIEAGIEPTKRPENLTIEDFAHLANMLAND